MTDLNPHAQSIYEIINVALIRLVRYKYISRNDAEELTDKLTDMIKWDKK